MLEPNNAEAGLHILLGGGIGVGKSAAGRRFSTLGATVVEADRIGHVLLERGGSAADDVALRWPEVVVGGSVDRASLAAIVFADPDALAELEHMTHPEIIRSIADLADLHHDLVVEIPVLLEPDGDWTKVLVRAPALLRRARAIERGGTPDDVDRRMASQVSVDAWGEWADEVIANVGTLDELNRGVDALWRRLKATDGKDTPA